MPKKSVINFVKALAKQRNKQLSKKLDIDEKTLDILFKSRGIPENVGAHVDDIIVAPRSPGGPREVYQADRYQQLWNTMRNMRFKSSSEAVRTLRKIVDEERVNPSHIYIIKDTEGKWRFFESTVANDDPFKPVR